METNAKSPRGPLSARAAALSAPTFRPSMLALEQRLAFSGIDAVQPTADEQYMLELINRARANPAAEGRGCSPWRRPTPCSRRRPRAGTSTRSSRTIASYAPEPPLAFNTRLIDAARDHDAAMLAANGQFHSPAGFLNDPGVAVAADGQAVLPDRATARGPRARTSSPTRRASTPASTDGRTSNYFEAGFLLDWGNPDFGHLKNILAPGPGRGHPAGASTRTARSAIGLLTDVTPTVAPGRATRSPANHGLERRPRPRDPGVRLADGQRLPTGASIATRPAPASIPPAKGSAASRSAPSGRKARGRSRPRPGTRAATRSPCRRGLTTSRRRGNLAGGRGRRS